MLLTFTEMLYALASGLLGAVVASWWWHFHASRRAAGASPCVKPPTADAPDRLNKLATQATLDIAVRLNELVAQVAFDVDEHNSHVQEINEELTSSKNHDSARILNVVMRLVEANQQMQEKLTSTEEKLHEQTDRMQTLVAETRTDALTLVANRRAFDDELVKRFAEFRRQGRTFSLTVVDVDDLKGFNDTYGHRAGDEALRNVAKVLRRNMRETDIVARYGGDEFAVIHPGTNLADACKSAWRACEAIEKHLVAHDGSNYRVTVSFGVAEIRANESAAEALKRADSATYASKKAGRNCVHFHDGESLQRLGQSVEPGLAPEPPPQPRQPLPTTHKDGEKAISSHGGDDATQSPGLAVPETPLELLGRTQFCQQVRNRMAEWKRGGPAFSVALIEVSQYDKSGADFSQRTRELASRVTARLLLAAIREMDVLGTYAPGCFAMMMPTAGLADAIRVADRLLEVLLQHTSSASGGQLTFALNFGIVQSVDSDDATSLLKRAEMALDAANRRGGNRVYCHDGDRVVPITAILEMETTGQLA